MKDGDSPDVIVITYGRCNAALELVADLLAVVPPAEWQTLARRMLDRELLVDDENFWAPLQRRRRRNLGKPIDPADIPSGSTKLTAGHLLLAAWLGYQHQETDDPPVDDLYHESGRLRVYEYDEARRIAHQRSGGMCEADELHHRNCPRDDRANPEQFVTHHIYPRERAKRDGLEGDPIVDHPANLLVVWNGYGSGAGGCHWRIHTERRLATELGYLARDLSHVVP